MTGNSDSQQGAGSAKSIRERINTSRRTLLKSVGAAVGAATIGGTTVTAATQQSDQNNIIMYVGDGQGTSHISIGRYLKAYQEDPDAFPQNTRSAEYNFDRHDNVGLTTVHPHDPDEVITDSAAAATTFSAGVKSYNGGVGGVEDNGEFREVTTILEAVREQGYATGLVTTARMTHATPAAFASHVPDRDQEDEIARQYVDDQNVDVLFGGGRRHFLPGSRDDGRDITQEFQDQGYNYVTTESELDSVNEEPTLGLFAPDSHMSYALDRMGDESEEPGLPKMTEKAIDILEAESGDNGFFLMVEAARIDHASHANDFAVAHEQTEADDAVGVILDRAAETANDTLVISTADHECGGLSLGTEGPYDVNYDVLDNVTASGEAMNEAISGVEEEFGDEGADEIADLIEEFGGFEPTETEVDAALGYGVGMKDVINERARIGWTTVGHTGEEVPTFASGPNAEQVNSMHDHIDLANIMFETAGIDNPNR
ncbi:alkaline phosphatase (plasmid) [Haloarcula sp. NS06]|uniref:alkaline phosphatase n=1 Tax=Haloarcula sp. NS06 TaxID=3409688 RepID=UPI003DA78B7E